MKLAIRAKDGGRYWHYNVSNIRESKNELRWTNARGEKREMALAFIDFYIPYEDHEEVILCSTPTMWKPGPMRKPSGTVPLET